MENNSEKILIAALFLPTLIMINPAHSETRINTAGEQPHSEIKTLQSVADRLDRIDHKLGVKTDALNTAETLQLPVFDLRGHFPFEKTDERKQAHVSTLDFPGHLEACTPAASEPKFPLIGTIKAEVSGMSNGKCAYQMELGGGHFVRCQLSEDERVDMAQMLRDFDKMADTGITVTAELSADNFILEDGVSADSMRESTKPPQDPMTAAFENGSCKSISPDQ